MIRALPIVIAGLAVLASSPALARNNGSNGSGTSEPAFAVRPVSDGELASVVGTGEYFGYSRAVARDEFESFNRLTGQVMPATFDNWLFDVASPLIISNLVR
jgi:hypothetical protein